MNLKEVFKQTRHPSDVDDYYHVFNRSNALNIIYWQFYFNQISKVSGDIVECGVGRGRSLISILSLLDYAQIAGGAFERGVYALDSFRGLPSPTESDASPRNPKAGEWGSSPNGQFAYSPANLKKILIKAEIPEERIEKLNILEGFFNETISEIKSNEIALLHLDGDLYESVRHPLFELAEKMSVGGCVVIDDYFLHESELVREDWPGARLAVNEFLDCHANFTIHESMRGTPYLLKQS